MNNNKVEGGPDPTLEFSDSCLFATGGLGEGSDTLVLWARKNKDGNLGYELEVAFPWNS